MDRGLWFLLGWLGGGLILALPAVLGLLDHRAERRAAGSDETSKGRGLSGTGDPGR